MRDDALGMSSTTVDLYWRSGQRVTVPLPGPPECRVLFDPVHNSLSLLTPMTGREPDVAKLRNITFATAADEGTVWGEVRIDVAEGSHQVAFAMVMTIANRLQQDGESLALAVPHAIDSYQDLLSRRRGLNDEQQCGLVGELLLLRHLVTPYGPSLAVAAWHGPLAEEHDFFFHDQHLEVKTTTGERRRHVIGGTSQLTQTPGTKLWLVSIQITAGAIGVGITLPGLVTSVREEIGEASPEFDRRLRAMGWDDDDADLYPAVWQLRSEPRCYIVEGDFPRITEELLANQAPSWTLLSEVRYRIDLTKFPHAKPPALLAGFAGTG